MNIAIAFIISIISIHLLKEYCQVIIFLGIFNNKVITSLIICILHLLLCNSHSHFMFHLFFKQIVYKKGIYDSQK